MKLPTAEEVQQAVDLMEIWSPPTKGGAEDEYRDAVATLRRVAEAWRNGVEVTTMNDRPGYLLEQPDD